MLRVPGWVQCCQDDVLVCPCPARAGHGVNPARNARLPVSLLLQRCRCLCHTQGRFVTLYPCIPKCYYRVQS